MSDAFAALQAFIDEHERVPPSGTRRNPLRFYSILEARRYARDGGVVLWATIWRRAGTFKIWPGGRTVHYPPD